MKNRDMWAFNIGLDHNQWIRWLNATNSFVFSAQLFWTHIMNNRRTYDRGDVEPGLLNDIFTTGVPVTAASPIGPGRTDPKLLNRPGGQGSRTNFCIPSGKKDPPCSFKRTAPQGNDSQIFTLAVSTTYMGGNLSPRFVFFYDWAGSYLMQPGLNWTFWDPFRMQLRYNYIDGKYSGIGFFKNKDSFWIELQYLLY